MSAVNGPPPDGEVLNLAEQVARQTTATKRLEKGLAELRGDDLAGNSAAVAELQPNEYRDEAVELLRDACRTCPASQTCCASMAKLLLPAPLPCRVRS
jgi:hypothetical protein